MTTDQPPAPPPARPPGRRGPRPATQPTARVRTAVLDAAHGLFTDGGFFGLTMDGLMARSGVSKATIYRWWDNRAAVALDVLAEHYARPADVEPGAPREELARVLRAETAYLRGPAGAIVAGLIADGQREAARAETFRRRYLDPRRSRLAGLLGQATDRGADEVERLADDVEATVYGALMLRPDLLTDAWVDRLCARLLD